MFTPAELGLTVAGVAVVGAVAGGWVTGHFTTQAARESAASARALASDQRTQERRKNAYVSIQRYIAKWEECAKWAADSQCRTADPQPLPPDISEDMQAVASLIASDEVVKAMTVFNRSLNQFRVASGHLEDGVKMNEAMPTGQKVNLKALFDNVRAYTDGVIATSEMVHKQMGSELGS